MFEVLLHVLEAASRRKRYVPLLMWQAINGYENTVVATKRSWKMTDWEFRPFYASKACAEISGNILSKIILPH